MRVGVTETVEAFDLLYRGLLNSEFRKSTRFDEQTERSLLPLVRTYLLGYFGESIIPEAVCSLPGGLSGKGKIDFVIGDLAVELAVRTKGHRSKAALSAKTNEPEVKKLLRHDGQALMVLFDFSAPHLENDDLEAYRTLPSLGRGSWKTSAFNLAYFYRHGRQRDPDRVVKRIRVGRARTPVAA